MWRQEKTDSGSDLVWDGVETGIAPSPLKGTANMQNVNISTDIGEAMVSYNRILQSQTALTSQTLTAVDSTLFTAPSTLQAGQWITISSTDISSPTINYLVVGGGGGGGGSTSGLGSDGGAGGGAGAYWEGTLASTDLVVGSYAITVGGGGAKGANTGAQGATGSNSSIAALVVATGGGGGGGTASGNGRNGGSGGGASGSSGTEGTPGTGVASHGHAGGNAASGGGACAGGGGGGATAVGAVAPNSSTGGAGGAGTASSISGASVTYAGGGGGSGSAAAGSGGAGGGGNGNGAGAGFAGTANTGGGGGGGYGAAETGGDGGSGIVIISYVTGVMTATGGTITTSGGNTIHTFTSSGTFTVTIPPFATGTYYVSYKNSSNQIKISGQYDPSVLHPVIHGTSGTATFSTYATVGSPIAKATEKYSDGSNTQYRYYILDSNSRVWVYDTLVYSTTLAANGIGEKWFLPSINVTLVGATGIGILNGWLIVIDTTSIYAKQTVNLGANFQAFNSLGSTGLMSVSVSSPTHFCYTGHQGKMFYTDGRYIGEIFPTTTNETSVANIQSYASYTVSGTTGTYTAIISGSVPYGVDTNNAQVRIPVVFFTDALGTQPTNLTAGVVYYIQQTSLGGLTFQVYSTLTDGSAILLDTGTAGNQYFNTFYPLGTHAGAGGDHSLMTFSNQRLNLPDFEIAQCLVEIGSTLLIGGITNSVYSWNQVDVFWSDVIALPESNVQSMLNVNNMAYIFAGRKGNVYITNNSVASLAIKIPDYCAGVPGTSLSYIEPVFTWGDSMYLRGRVYCSILDQTSTKAGNCGGIWSFIPTQNFYMGQDIGMALRLENQNSYGSYNGMSTILIPSEDQSVTAPQYWSGWRNSYTVGVSSSFGIDFTDTVPTTTAAIETDLLATGTFFSQTTLDHVEYKLSIPLATGDSIQLYYRKNITDSWTSCGDVIQETANPLSGYFRPNFQTTQWLQIRAILTSVGTTASSFVRLREIRIR